jgi:hypothetical protein
LDAWLLTMSGMLQWVSFLPRAKQFLHPALISLNGSQTKSAIFQSVQFNTIVLTRSTIVFILVQDIVLSSCGASGHKSP